MSSSSISKTMSSSSGESSEISPFPLEEIIFAIENFSPENLFSAGGYGYNHNHTESPKSKTMSSSSGVQQEKFLIPLEEIILATENFSRENCIGVGGYGVVYKGQLSKRWGNRTAAIKRPRGNFSQQMEEFEKELEMVSKFHHQNIIPFIGYCNEGDKMIMVYEYAINGSLDDHILDPNRRRSLTWAKRLKICIGAAEGLGYLHSGLGDEHKVIHRDVKSANILLDDNMEAKICDFGLSRSAPRHQEYSGVQTNVAGTPCYCDPLYRESEILTKESDVFSFGVVLFEMLCGLLAYNTRRIGCDSPLTLMNLVRQNWNDGLAKIIDVDIIDQIYSHSLETFKRVAYRCVSYHLKERPNMDRIVMEIQKALEFQENKDIYPQDYKDLDYDEFRYMDLPLTGVESIKLFKVSGKKCYMLGARELYIEGRDPRTWKWEHRPGSRFAEVGILIIVRWLLIRGNIATSMLSQKTTYVAYLVFRIDNGSNVGLDVAAKTIVSFSRKENETSNETSNVYLMKPRSSHTQENDRFPHQRIDGWMEIELGEFYCDEGDDGDVEMIFKEDRLDSNGHKRGLIVEGIEVRLK